MVDIYDWDAEDQAEWDASRGEHQRDLELEDDVTWYSSTCFGDCCSPTPPEPNTGGLIEPGGIAPVGEYVTVGHDTNISDLPVAGPTVEFEIELTDPNPKLVQKLLQAAERHQTIETQAQLRSGAIARWAEWPMVRQPTADAIGHAQLCWCCDGPIVYSPHYNVWAHASPRIYASSNLHVAHPVGWRP